MTYSHSQIKEEKMTNTFRVTASATYLLAVDGASFERFGLQAASYADVRVFIGTAPPAEDTEDYLSLSAGGTRELTAGLGSADKVYVRAGGGSVTAVRGFRETRT